MNLFKFLFCEFFLFCLAYQLYVKNEKIFCYVTILFMIIAFLGYFVLNKPFLIDNEGVIVPNLNNFKNKIFWKHIQAIEPINTLSVKFTGIAIKEQYEQLYLDQMTEKQVKVYVDNKNRLGCGFCIMGTYNLKKMQFALKNNCKDAE